ncbi:MAG: hypothetical protein HYY24_28340 [Verrucomicrobia bacterium]|nr:hypothetical protein [Verrucomicrobiota bacterium]
MKAFEQVNFPRQNQAPTGAEQVSLASGFPGAVSWSAGFDLLRVPGVRALVQWRGFPYVFQAVMLAAFLALAAICWDVDTPARLNAKLFAKPHLATLWIPGR